MILIFALTPTMSFRLLSRVSLSCALVCVLGQCKKPASPGGAAQAALATVAGTPITGEDLIKEAEWRRANHQAVPAPEELLKEMVNRLSLVERAKQAGLDRDSDTRRRIESLLIASLREKELDPKLSELQVGDDELAAAYEARKEAFTRKGLDRFAIVFQAVLPNASDARRSEARDRLKSAMALADANPAPGGRGAAAGGFGPAAAEYSEDQLTRYKGGDIGWIETDATQTRLPEAVLTAGRALQKGARSEVIECPDGYYVVMKTDTRAGGVLPFNEVSERLRQALLREKRHAHEEAFLKEALTLAKAELDTAAAQKVSLPSSAPAIQSQTVPPSFPGEAQPAAAR